MFKLIATYNPEAQVGLDVPEHVDPHVGHLRRLAFMFLRRSNKPAALLCLDRVFFRFPSLLKAGLVETESLLSVYLTYVRQLDQIWRNGRLSEGSDCQKIFAFEVQQEDHYVVPSNTFLHGKISASRGNLDNPPSEYICSHEELGRAISEAILGHLKARVSTQEHACRGTRGFSPCLNTLLRKHCSYEPCQFQHIPANEITLDWFHVRLRFFFLEFQILRVAQLYDEKVMQWVRLGISLYLC